MLTQSQSRATTPATDDGPVSLVSQGHAPASLVSQGRQRSRSELTPVREGLRLGTLSRENSSLGRRSGGVTPAHEVGDATGATLS